MNSTDKNQRCDMDTQNKTPRSVQFESIPQALKDPPQWVLWCEEERDGRMTKIPYQAGGSLASSTDPDTWGDFDTARKAFRGGDFDGIGFVFAEEGPFVGVDLDDCFDGGALTDGALGVVERLDSYTETSPSDTGLHVICRGFIPHERNRTGDADGMKELEIYEDSRYFTFTGAHLEGTPDAPEQRARELYSLCTDLFGTAEKNATDEGQTGALAAQITRSDAEILELIRSSDQGAKFERLWTGETAGYSSHSEADQALCCILSFWTQRDRERVDRLFRKSALYREEKWERDSYREPTLDTAMNVNEVYTPANRVTANGQGDGKGDGKNQNAVTQKSPSGADEGRKSPQGDGNDGILSTFRSEGGKQRKQADIIRDLAADVEMFETPEGKVYASFEVEGHRETWPADSDRFEMHLMRLFDRAEGKTPDAQALKDAGRMMKAEALFDRETTEVHTRVGRGEDGALYIDLCDEEWRAVRVDEEGWEIVDRPPVHFRRSRSMEPLPVPERDGSIKALKPFVNAGDKDWRLVVAWLVAALRPEGPYPALVLQGEQGSAKSTLARFLRTLVDPSAAPLRSPSRNQRDLMITATNSHVIAFDNVSGLKTWLSDALCSLATGGGFATRELHTDTEEIIFNAMRPAVLTGIEDVATRDDLAERSLVLTLSAIREEDRMSERALNQRFEAAAPKILAGILDALSAAERRVGHVKLENPPRMADFAEWVVAAESALPWNEGEFMGAYDENRTTAVLDNIQMNPLASGIRELMEREDGSKWQGTPSELKDRLDSIVPESDQSAKVYPGSPSWVTRRINRVKKMLREAGIEVETPRVSGKRMIRITGGTHKSGENAVNAVTQPEKSPPDGAEGRKQGDGKNSMPSPDAVTQAAQGDGKNAPTGKFNGFERGDPVETPDGAGTVKERRPGDPPTLLVSFDHGPSRRYSPGSLTRQDEAPF